MNLNSPYNVRVIMVKSYRVRFAAVRWSMEWLKSLPWRSGRMQNYELLNSTVCRDPPSPVHHTTQLTSEGKVSSTRMLGPVASGIASGPNAQMEWAANRSQSYLLWKKSPIVFLLYRLSAPPPLNLFSQSLNSPEAPIHCQFVPKESN